ncbi:50s ribosomal protein l28 [Nannochloropsis gaditana]|uniref:50s ribosomal protein l28 n=1 Tax=Nannochloropsis gaditana TaxID=72520 RepID=W7U2Y2_9STRA|nr:50s ribosomal protein l28 [Nannochloropsis gaditana]
MKAFSFLMVFLSVALAQAFLAPATFQVPRAMDALSPSPVAPARKSLMVMRERKCELLGKRANRQCRSVSFSHIRNKKTQGVNLHEKRVWWAEGSKFVRLRLSTKGWRTVKKYGLNKAFAKFEVDLHQFQAQH